MSISPWLLGPGPALPVPGLVIADPARIAGLARVAGPVMVIDPARLAEPVRVDGQEIPVEPGTADSALGAAVAAAVVVGTDSWFVGGPRRWPEKYRILNLFAVVGTSQSCHCSAG